MRNPASSAPWRRNGSTFVKLKMRRASPKTLRQTFRKKKAVASADVADILDNTLHAHAPNRPDQVEIREGGRTVGAGVVAKIFDIK